jgi:WD40 repeat protein
MKYLLGLFTLVQLSSHCFAQDASLILPLRRTDSVLSVNFSPGGRRLVTASVDRTVKIAIMKRKPSCASKSKKSN